MSALRIEAASVKAWSLSDNALSRLPTTNVSVSMDADLDALCATPDDTTNDDASARQNRAITNSHWPPSNSHQSSSVVLSLGMPLALKLY